MSGQKAPYQPAPKYSFTLWQRYPHGDWQLLLQWSQPFVHAVAATLRRAQPGVQFMVCEPGRVPPV